MKMHVKKNDKVVVISGADKGSKGEILAVYPKTGKVIVKGVNIVKKHQKATRNNMKSAIIEMEAPIDASNVMLFDEKRNMAFRPSYKYDENGAKVRFNNSKKNSK